MNRILQIACFSFFGLLYQPYFCLASAHETELTYACSASNLAIHPLYELLDEKYSPHDIADFDNKWCDDAKLIHHSTRFFIMKPVGKGIIRKAMKSGIYSIQARAAAKINLALARGIPVVLIFSSLGSGCFQGAASVLGPIDVAHGKKRGNAQLQWLTNFTNAEFDSLTHAFSREKESRKITESQDGDEISFNAGILLITVLSQLDGVRAVSNGSFDYYNASPKPHRCAGCWQALQCEGSVESCIQYFPCRDILCRHCRDIINQAIPVRSVPIECALCRYDHASYIGLIKGDGR